MQNCNCCYVHPHCNKHILINLENNTTERSLLPLSPIYDNLLEIEEFKAYTKCEKNLELGSKVCFNFSGCILMSLIIAYLSWVLTGMINIA